MPWHPGEASRFTKKAKTPAQKRLWARVANKALQEGASDGRAVRIANGALKRAVENRGRARG